MKSLIIRTISFILVFCLLFTVVSSVLHHRWLHSNNLYERLIDYENEADDDVDVLCFGTSEVLNSYSPMETYHEEGITGCNFAIAWKSAPTQYYQLKYALSKHTPKVVMCDFSALFEDCLPQENMNVYAKVLDTMPDFKIREEMIREIMKLDPSQDYFVLEFPMFRYHNMWTSLSEENFGVEKVYNKEYKSYKKGVNLNNKTFEGGLIEINEEVWAPEGEVKPFSDISVEYYDKFIKECQDRGIAVVAYLPPKVIDGSVVAMNLPHMMEYFESRGVECLNYNTYETFLDADFDLEIDFRDISHVNAPGAVKISKLIAKDLKEKYGLSDHRNDLVVSTEWDVQWEELKRTEVARQSSPYSQIDMAQALGLTYSVEIPGYGERIDLDFRGLRDFANENPGNEYFIKVYDENDELICDSDWKYEEGWVDSNNLLSGADVNSLDEADDQ